MKKLIVVLSVFMTCSAFANESSTNEFSDEWPRCEQTAQGCKHKRPILLPSEDCLRSKNPRCWEQPESGGFKREPFLSCDKFGNVSLGGYIGEGPGCGESPSVVLTEQTIDPANQSVRVSTSLVPKSPTLPPMCHYWGPLQGSVGLHLPPGQWTVYADGKLAGTVEVEVIYKRVNGAWLSEATCKLRE